MTFIRKEVFFFLVLLFFCFAKCKIKNYSNERVDIVIEIVQSYKYDIGKKVYTVYFLEKKPNEIFFELSKEEDMKVQEKYYALNLDKCNGNFEIENNCLITPKLYTVVTMNSKNNKQRIKIYSDCNKYSSKDLKMAKRVNEFINFIIELVQKKPEIRNAIPSDMLYF
ncbi:MAG: hypothetical protein SGI83_03510 [Bacteroidota bacterium]|nr:hypothetical protein [Bacteroidota bacterium]